MIIQRDILPLLLEYSREFRSVAIVGPRQSGKSTLTKVAFPHKPYVSLENPDERLLAETDGRAFLNRFPEGAIIDEVQRVPTIFNFLQEILDRTDEDGLFVLTGSNHFLLQENVSQTLAGRIGYLELFPFTYQELSRLESNSRDTNQMILRGGYPEVWQKKRNPKIWYPSYIKTYVERDVRQIRNIGDSNTFIRFLKLCAGRIGQLVNFNSLSTEAGVDLRTAKAWLSVLESSFVIFLLQPHYVNFNKRLVKTPKLYFTDTGLACSLLGLQNESEVALSHFRGSLFENLVMVEMKKHICNTGTPHQMFFWRDNHGLEIDLLLESGSDLHPFEIKSAQTYQPTLLDNVKKWREISGLGKGTLLYDGQMEMTLTDGNSIMNWKNVDGIIQNKRT